MESLAQLASDTAIRAALTYLRQHQLSADDGALSDCLKVHVKARLPEALADAKEALACGMTQIADATFRASMAQAGIAAAREAGEPRDAA